MVNFFSSLLVIVVKQVTDLESTYSIFCSLCYGQCNPLFALCIRLALHSLLGTLQPDHQCNFCQKPKKQATFGWLYDEPDQSWKPKNEHAKHLPGNEHVLSIMQSILILMIEWVTKKEFSKVCINGWRIGWRFDPAHHWQFAFWSFLEPSHTWCCRSSGLISAQFSLHIQLWNKI